VIIACGVSRGAFCRTRGDKRFALGILPARCRVTRRGEETPIQTTSAERSGTLDDKQLETCWPWAFAMESAQ